MKCLRSPSEGDAAPAHSACRVTSDGSDPSELPDGREPVSSRTTTGYKNDEAKADDAVTSLALFREVSLSWRCQDGWPYSDEQAVLAAECENRAGRKTGETLTLIRPD